jgi:hypothetical protein
MPSNTIGKKWYHGLGETVSCRSTMHSSVVVLRGWTAILLNAMSEPSLLVELREAINHGLSTLLLFYSVHSHVKVLYFG